MQVTEVTDASKHRKGRTEALALARSARRILVAKGKKIVAIDMTDAPDDNALADLLLGPTGNLRAPTLKKGKLLCVGFSEETYRQLVRQQS
jgi:arsenate reductase-like glutaredoxin family protein